MPDDDSTIDSQEPEADEGLGVRVLGTALTPFVIVGEWLGNGVLRFFEFAEKLDPFALAQRLLSPLQPLALRIGRFFQTLFDPLWSALHSIVSALLGWLRPFASVVGRTTRRISNWFARQWSAILRVTASTRSALMSFGRRVRTIWNRALEPVRSARAAASRLATRVRNAVRRR